MSSIATEKAAVAAIGSDHGKRLDFIDCARGFAAVAVVAQHVLEMRYPGFYKFSESYFNFGTFGVTLFFVISGFVIPPSIVNVGLRRFWIARVFRLYPLYWLALVLAAFFSIGAFSPENSPANRFAIFAANFTMLQEYVGMPHALALFWTLSMELAFYVMCSILFKLGLLNKAILLSAGSAIALVIGGLIFLLALDKSFPMGRGVMLVTAFFGAFMYQFASGKIAKKSLLLTITIVAASLVASAVIRFGISPPTKRLGEANLSFVAVLTSWTAAYLVFLCLFRMRRRFKVPAGLVFLGTCSYSIYLIHPFVIAALPVAMPAPIWVISILLLTGLASALTWTFFEKPIILVGKAYSKARWS